MELTLSLLLLLLLLICGLQVRCGWGVRLEFRISSGKCVSEDIQNDIIVVGSYRVITENLPETKHVKIRAQILSPDGSRLHYGDNVEGQNFGFHTKVSGIYTICFWVDNDLSNEIMAVDFDMKTGMAAKDWNTVAKKEKIEGLELELRKLEDAVDYVHRGMLHLRERESEMRDINEKTNARVAWFSIGSLFICLTVAGWQLWHLKSYFVRKKLL